jgi:hypothetical protein
MQILQRNYSKMVTNKTHKSQHLRIWSLRGASYWQYFFKSGDQLYPISLKHEGQLKKVL